MLSAKTIGIIKTITPAVAANAEAITKIFYERMFRDSPEVRDFFNQAHQQAGTQQRALAGAIAAYFIHIENPGVLAPAIEVIAQKHCSLQIRPEHYPIVGRHLLAAIKDVFVDAASTDVLEAVNEAYEFLAKVCIEREKQIYDEQLNQPGGWNGFRDFTVTNKVVESDSVTSFYLAPSDGGKLPKFKPGQYTTVRVNSSAGQVAQRNYSLSDLPGNGYFRISVKREAGGIVPCGMVSNFLHDYLNVGHTVQLAPPSGDFYFDKGAIGNAPVVFLAGGIGVTPLLSMAKSIVADKSTNQIDFLLASPNSKTCAFTNELRSLAKEACTFRTFILFDEPLIDDLKEGRCDHKGRINREILADFPCSEAHFYVCGPKLFMQSVFDSLNVLEVARDRIHFEFFGPMENII